MDYDTELEEESLITHIENCEDAKYESNGIYVREDGTKFTLTDAPSFEPFVANPYDGGYEGGWECNYIIEEIETVLGIEVSDD